MTDRSVGALSDHDIPDFLVVLQLVHMDPLTGVDTRRDLMVAIDTVCQSLNKVSDGGVEIVSDSTTSSECCLYQYHRRSESVTNYSNSPRIYHRSTWPSSYLPLPAVGVRERAKSQGGWRIVYWSRMIT